MRTNRRTTRAARQLYRLCLVGDALDAGRARLVADRLASSHRRGSIPLLSNFLRLVRLDRDRHMARIESAAPLGDSDRTRIRSDLARTYGSALETSFAENPALIGGVRVKVGSDVYDGTIRARLAALEARL